MSFGRILLLAVGVLVLCGIGQQYSRSVLRIFGAPPSVEWLLN